MCVVSEEEEKKPQDPNFNNTNKREKKFKNIFDYLIRKKECFFFYVQISNKERIKIFGVFEDCCC